MVEPAELGKVIHQCKESLTDHFGNGLEEFLERREIYDNLKGEIGKIFSVVLFLTC